MRLTEETKTADVFERVLEINDASFSGISRVPRGIFKTHFDRDEVFIVQWGGPIVGFAIVTERPGAYIWQIAVNPDHREQGLGSRLLKEIEMFYRNAGRQVIELTCNTENPAQKLYFDHGYRVTRVAQRYYQNEGNGLFMRKIL